MRFIKVVLLFIFILTLTTSLIFAAETPYIKAKVYLDSKAQWQEFKKMQLDEVYHGADYIEIVTNQNELNRLSALGFRVEIDIPDLTEFYQSRLDRTKDMGGYKTLDEINAYLDGIIAGHPNIVSTKISIGQTIEGRSTWAVKISDNPGVDEDEPEVLFTAAIHAREVITPEVLFYFMDYITNNYGTIPTVTDLVDNREIWFVVTVNPDGYYYNQVIAPTGGGMWRKNRRNNGDGTYGIDLNRNYGYMWGYDDIGSSPNTDAATYRGTGPFSEPETQNMRDFISAHNFVITLYFHSYSNLILYPWGYDRIYTPDNDIFVPLGDTIHALNGYSPGPGWGLYLVNGDSDDWGYGEQTTKNKNFAITIEVGTYDDGFWPTIHRKTELVQENLQPCLFVARVVGYIYQLRPPAKPALTTPDNVDRLDYDVTWSHNDTLNPAFQYELIEYQNKSRRDDSASNWNNWINTGFILTTGRSHTPTTSFFSGANNGTTIYMQTKNPIRVNANDTLKLWTFYDIETEYDYAYIEASTDGTIFTPLEGNITTNYDPNGANRGNGITGSSGGIWVEGKFSLASYVGMDVFIRATYSTDSYLTEEGFYFDDIYPIETYGIETIVSSSLTDTLYHFTNRAEGYYYYKVRARDAQGQWSQFSPLDEVFAGTGSAFICGDASGNSFVNIQDVTFTINFLYKGGPAPVPMISADVNNSGNVNISDVSYLVNFLYKGGSAPDCP
jgi:hypothetical protein